MTIARLAPTAFAICFAHRAHYLQILAVALLQEVQCDILVVAQGDILKNSHNKDSLEADSG